jgi:hypothetical protein
MTRRPSARIGPFRFAGLFVREALRHSLDIAQAIIFVAILSAGAVAGFYPPA